MIMFWILGCSHHLLEKLTHSKSLHDAINLQQ